MNGGSDRSRWLHCDHTALYFTVDAHTQRDDISELETGDPRPFDSATPRPRRRRRTAATPRPCKVGSTLMRADTRRAPHTRCSQTGAAGTTAEPISLCDWSRSLAPLSARAQGRVERGKQRSGGTVGQHVTVPVPRPPSNRAGPGNCTLRCSPSLASLLGPMRALSVAAAGCASVSWNQAETPHDSLRRNQNNSNEDNSEGDESSEQSDERRRTKLAHKNRKGVDLGLTPTSSRLFLFVAHAPRACNPHAEVT